MLSDILQFPQFCCRGGDSYPESPCIYSCSAQVGGLYGTKENLIRCEKGVKLPKKGVKSLI